MLHLAYRRGKEAQLASLRALLLATARVAASEIDGDEFATIPIDASAIGDPRNRALRRQLERVRRAHPDFQAAYALSVVDPPKPGWGRFVGGDTEEEVGRAYDMTRFRGMARALESGSATDDDVEAADEWGRSLSGYAAIRDRSGKAVGLLGIDVQDTT